jgi:hypothetical protein
LASRVRKENKVTQDITREELQEKMNSGDDLRDPRIALSIVDPENPHRYLEVRSEMVRIEEDPNLGFINSMAKKYLGLNRYPYHRPGGERVVVGVEPRHTTRMGR